MTLEKGLELLESFDGNQKTFRQYIEYLVSQGAEWVEGEEILREYMIRNGPSPDDERAFLDGKTLKLDGITLHKKREGS